MSGRSFQDSEPVVGHPEHNVAFADDAVDMLPVTADDQGSDSLDPHLLTHVRDESVGGDCLDLRPLGSQNGSDIHASPPHRFRVHDRALTPLPTAGAQAALTTWREECRLPGSSRNARHRSSPGRVAGWRAITKVSELLVADPALRPSTASRRDSVVAVVDDRRREVGELALLGGQLSGVEDVGGLCEGAQQLWGRLAQARNTLARKPSLSIVVIVPSISRTRGSTPGSSGSTGARWPCPGSAGQRHRRPGRGGLDLSGDPYE